MALVSGEKTFRLALDDKWNSQDELKSKLELNETPELRETALRNLKDMMRGVPNLNACMDDDYLLLFLRARKFDCHRAFSLLQNFYTIRAQCPEILQSISKVEPLLRNGVFTVLPYRDEEGSVVNIFNTSTWDPDEYSFWDVAATIILASESNFYDPVTQINGYVYICDVQKFSMKHFLELSSLKKLSTFSNLLNDSNPIRIKKVLVINAPQLVETFWVLIKPLLSGKLEDRVQFVGDMSEIHQFLDPAILPQEYGGKLPSLDYHKFAQTVKDREEYVNYIRQFGFTKKRETTEKYTKINEDDIW